MGSTQYILILFLTSFVACLSYYFWAKKKQIVDIPNDRSSHKHSPVKGMGLALIAPILAHFIISPEFDYITLGVLIAIVTGYLDDRRNLKVYIRLPLYFVAILLCTLEIIGNPLNSELPLLLHLAVIVIAVGVINTYNFMDGINGITGLYTVVFLFTAYFLFEEIGNIHEWIYQLIIAVGSFIVIFGVFNFQNKARAFLGDSGSVALGLIVSTLVIVMGVALHSWEVIVLLAVYGVDSVATIVLRLLRRENIFEAHRSHLYQDLVHVKKWSHITVSAIYALVQLGINVICFKLIVEDKMNGLTVLLIIGGLTISYLLVKKQLNQLNFKRITHE